MVLLQVSLGQVLEVLSRELDVGHDNDLGTFGRDGNVVAEVAEVAIDLDVLHQVLDVPVLVKNTILDRGRGVNDKLLNGLGGLVGLESHVSLLHLYHRYTLNGVVDKDSIAHGRGL